MISLSVTVYYPPQLSRTESVCPFFLVRDASPFFTHGFSKSMSLPVCTGSDGSWANFSGRKRNPGNFPGFNGQGGPNRRAAMAEHAADGKTRSPTGLLRSARDLHFNIPTF